MTDGRLTPKIISKHLFVCGELTFYGLLIEVIIIKSDYIGGEDMQHILAALMPANRLALVTSIYTGLRIGDVLALKSCYLLQDRFTVKEQKTGKSKRIRLPNKLRDELTQIAGRYYIFEGRCNPKQHRTRQAVFKDLERAAKLYRLDGHVSPHSARKIYAVEELKRTKSVKRVQQLLNHESEAVTLLYALSDELSRKSKK